MIASVSICASPRPPVTASSEFSTGIVYWPDCIYNLRSAGLSVSQPSIQLLTILHQVYKAEMKRTQGLVRLLLGVATLLASGRAQDCDPADQIWDTVCSLLRLMRRHFSQTDLKLQPGTVDSLTWAPCFNATLCAKLQVLSSPDRWHRLF